MNYKDIKPFTPDGGYQVDIPLAYLIDSVDRYTKEYDLDLDPDFQRGHVWTDNQRIRYVEYLFREGQSSRIIYFNHHSWQGSYNKSHRLTIVDGLQRLTACLMILNDEIPIFGTLKSEFTGKMSIMIGLKFAINNLKTRAEVLQWYLDLNSGGTVHADSEIKRVKALLETEQKS
mgnify:CR=1 FL=1